MEYNKNFETTCSALLKELRPVDLDKLVELVDTYPNDVSHYKGKRVIALCGPTGVGKSTTIQYLHGASFTAVKESTSFRSHLKNSFTEEQLAKGGKNLGNVKTSGSFASETVYVNATQIEFDGEEWYVLDTPGFGETKGVEFDIVNGLNISSALKVCSSVKLVIVLSDYCLGDRLLNGSETKDCCRTVLNMLTSEDSIDSLSYIFTKMDKGQSIAISQLFREASRQLRLDDKDIQSIWSDIAFKTSPTAMVVCPLTDTAEDRKAISSRLFSSNGVISDPCTTFSNCIPYKSRNALSAQLILNRESIVNALEAKNILLLSYRLDQLKALSVRSNLAAIAICRCSYTDSVQSFIDHLEGKYRDFKKKMSSTTIALSDHERGEMAETLQLVCTFDSIRRERLSEKNPIFLRDMGIWTYRTTVE